jgi:hypothetical protein
MSFISADSILQIITPVLLIYTMYMYSGNKYFPNKKYTMIMFCFFTSETYKDFLTPPPALPLPT